VKGPQSWPEESGQDDKWSLLPDSGDDAADQERP
jgi:hypothetical protein